MKRGKRNGAKVSEDQVREIRAEWAKARAEERMAGVTLGWLAKQYALSPHTIGRIVHNDSWSDLT